MCEVTIQQTPYTIEIQTNIPIYDQDNFLIQQQIKQQNNQNQPSSRNNTSSQHNKIIVQIDKQIQSSKTNFFKINIIDQQSSHSQHSYRNKSGKIYNNLQNYLTKYPTKIIKQGYMYKKTNSLLFKWKMRYFLLNSQKLFFFEDHQKLSIIGCINFKILSSKIYKQNDQIIIDFNGQCDNVIFRCDNKKQRQQWIYLLGQVLKFQAKQQKILLKTLVKPLYHFQNSITEKQFNQIAQTGDILLFYTRNTGAKIQRIITNSDFDHVAMVIKLRKNQVMVFQSNQMHGVTVYQWNQYIRYFNLYDKATLRQLHSIRKEQYHNSLLTFIKKNLGKKYDLSAKKLFKLESDSNWNQNHQENQRGYFCSQLIAKAYKSIGLMVNQKKYSGRYWPVDFTEKQKLGLRNGAFLGTQINIILNRNIKNIL